MKILQKICFVLLLTTFSNVYGGSCWDEIPDIDDCRVRAKQGDYLSQAILGDMYYNGLGVPQDYKESFKWIRLAAEQGFSESQFNLGNMYHNGQGVLQDYKEAVKWYTKSAEQGYSLAQFNLGVMYAKGQGVLQEYVMAHMYWNIAAVSGNKSAIKNRGIVEKKMTSSQIAEAQKLAREWMRTHQN